MLKFRLLVLLGALSLSCAHSPKSSPSARIITVAPDAQIIQIEMRSGDRVQKLSRDTALPIGAELALLVELAGPGYVYLVRSPRLEASERLYPPPSSPAAVIDGGTVRIPGPGAWIRLARFKPEDLLCLLLSAQPLPLSEQRCEPTRRGGRNDDDPPTPPPTPRETSLPPLPPPPPPPVDPRGPDEDRKVKVIRLMVQGAS